MKSKQRGFTLIELMMVIAIIGILASIALPSYQTYIYQAKAANVISVLDNVRTALAAFQAEKGTISGQYCVHDSTYSPPTVGSALVYADNVRGGAKPKGEVSGMARGGLTLDHLGVNIRVLSCVSDADSPGQYLAVVLPIRASDAQARQVALAVQHAMQKQAYKSQTGSSGAVYLYFQL